MAILTIPGMRNRGATVLIAKSEKRKTFATSRRRRRIFRILLGSLIVLSLVLGDLIGAWIYRLAKPNRVRIIYRFDPVLGRRAHATPVRTRRWWPAAPGGAVHNFLNNRGFWERADTPLEKIDAYRVIVFGDSHTVAGGVDQSYPAATETILRSRSRSVEVINAAVPGYSLYQELLRFKEHLDLKPDLAVFTFYCGNDYEDLFRPRDNPRLVLNERGEVVAEPPVPKTTPPRPGGSPNTV